MTDPDLLRRAATLLRTDPNAGGADPSVAAALAVLLDLEAEAWEIYETPRDGIVAVARAVLGEASAVPAPRCVHHGVEACPACSANPGSCGDPDAVQVGCGHYAATGMHWDTCPNRVDGEVTR